MSSALANIRAIMFSMPFRWGVQDHRAGRQSSENMPPNSDLNYDRGQQWAAIAPPNMPLKINGRLNPEAISVYEQAAIV